MAAFDFLKAKLKDLSFKIAFVSQNNKHNNSKVSKIYILIRERNKKLGGKDLKDAVITAWHFVISIYLRAKFNMLGNPRAGKETKRGLEITNVKKAVFGRLIYRTLSITCIITFILFHNYRRHRTTEFLYQQL